MDDGDPLICSGLPFEKNGLSSENGCWHCFFGALGEDSVGDSLKDAVLPGKSPNNLNNRNILTYGGTYSDSRSKKRRCENINNYFVPVSAVCCNRFTGLFPGGIEWTFLLCRTRCVFSLNAFVQCSQWNGLSSEWTTICRLYKPRLTNVFLHTSHSCNFFGLCLAAV